jgi:hypothetical protein
VRSCESSQKIDRLLPRDGRSLRQLDAAQIRTGIGLTKHDSIHITICLQYRPKKSFISHREVGFFNTFWPTTVLLYGFNFSSFAAVRDISETPIS